MMIFGYLFLAIYVLVKGFSPFLNGLCILCLVMTVLLFGILIISILIDGRSRTKQVGKNEIADLVNGMTGEQFENFIAQKLQESGWKDIEITPVTGDHGVDVIAVCDGEKYVFQCKRYKFAVSTRAVQEVYTGKGVYGADHAVVITNSTFTPKSRKMAEKLAVELWDLNQFEKVLDDEKYHNLTQTDIKGD